jgi:hypothetical protein
MAPCPSERRGEEPCTGAASPAPRRVLSHKGGLAQRLETVEEGSETTRVTYLRRLRRLVGHPSQAS